MRLKMSAAGVAAVLVAASLSACGGGGAGTSSSAANSGPFTVAVQSVPQKWDPYQVTWGVIMQPLQAAYDTLVHKNTDGSFAPGLATEWSYPDQTHFQLTIRKGVVFSDGTALDPAAVKKNLDRRTTVTGPKVNLLKNVADVKVDGADKVVLTLSASDPSLPLVFSQNMGMMVSPKALDEVPALEKAPVGAGAYTMDVAKTTANDTYTFVKNPKYWEADKVGFNTLVFKLMKDTTASLNAMRAGQIDATVGDRTNAEAAKSAGMKVLDHVSYFAGFRLQDRNGTQVPALGDVRVRQALNYAVDRNALQATLGTGRSTTQIFPEGTTGYDSSLDKAYPYDPDKAKKLLAEAGHGNGLTLELLSTDVAFFGTYAQAVAAQLAKVGVTVKLNTVQLSQWQADQYTTKTPMVSWFFNFVDAWLDAQQILQPQGLMNPYKVTDPEVQALLAKAATETGSAQQATMRQVSKIVVDKAFFLVTNIGNSYYFFNPKKVKDLQFTTFEAQPNVTKLQPAS